MDSGPIPLHPRWPLPISRNNYRMLLTCWVDSALLAFYPLGPLPVVSSFDANFKYQTLAFLEDPGSRDEVQGCLGVHMFDSSIVSTLVAGSDHLR